MSDYLAGLNREINAAIKYKPDAGNVWQSPAITEQNAVGDCEDIALYKMHRIQKDRPEMDLRLGHVWTKDGRAHMVLFADGQVLDNLTNEVQPAEQSGYKTLYQIGANGQVYDAQGKLIPGGQSSTFNKAWGLE